MAFDETSDGADYLSALKRSGEPQAAGAATARAPDPVPGGTRVGEVAPSSRANPARVEKRKTPRYRCKGSARLQASGSAVATWATFADISLQGCYVEAASPLRVGTVLGLKLEVNGFRVEATGEVRVAYPNLGMGISFIKISEKDREQLRELVTSISRPQRLEARKVQPALSRFRHRTSCPARPTRAPHCRRCGASLKTATSWAGKNSSGSCEQASSKSPRS